MGVASDKASAAICLVCGEDDYSSKERARRVYEQWCRELGGMDHEVIDGAVSNSAEALRALARVREALQTLPFFGGAKVVWLKDCSFLADDRVSQARDILDSLEALGGELKTLPWDNLRLLLSAGRVDRRRTFCKTIEKLGRVEVFAGLAEDKDWAGKAEGAALKALQACQSSISEGALAELVASVGPDLRLLHQELEKLVLYVGEGRTIELADVRAVVTRNKQARAFALADALGNRDLAGTLARLEEEMWAMRSDKERSEIGLLYGLIAKVRAMILLKELQREQWLKPEAEGSYGRFKARLESLPAERMPGDKRFNPQQIHAFVLFNSLPHARKYSLEELVRAMELLLECNRRLVSSQLDAKLVLQQTLIQIVRGDAAARPARSGERT